jgi:hypothetical protein
MNLMSLFPKVEKEISEEGTPPGRKFLFGRYTLLLATLGFLASALAAPLATNFTIFIGALATLYTIYCGGNVSDKWVQKPVNTKVILDRRKTTPTPTEDKPEGPAGKPDDGPGAAGA